jgi:hypothetical protein
MTGNLQAIGFLFTWVLGWGIGGSLIDAALEGPSVGAALTVVLWTLLWGSGGAWLFRRWTQPQGPGR